MEGPDKAEPLTFDEILRGSESRRWTLEIAALQQFRADNGPFGRRHAETLLKRAQELIDKGKAHGAAELLFAGLVVDHPAVLAGVQKAGLFRLSRRQYIGGCTAVTARLLCEALERLSHPAALYLRSVVNLHVVARAARAEYRGVAAWLSREREAGVKGAMATLDWIFLTATYAPSGAEEGWRLPSGPEYGPEHLAEGLSTILAIYEERFGRLRDNTAIDARAAARGDYVRFLLSASRLAQFRAWELLVDRLDYGVVPVPGTGVFRVGASSFEFHRAVEMGFTHSTIQRATKPAEAVHPGARSFVAFGREFTTDGRGDQLVKRVDTPVPRYRLELPAEVLSSLKHVGELMGEEQLALAGACHDLVATTEEVLGFELDNGVRMRDFFLVSRLLQMMRCISAEMLLRHASGDFEAVLQSMVPTLHRDNLINSVRLAVDPHAAAAVVRLLEADLSSYVDIQYRPLVPAGSQGELLMIPLNVVASSNLYRNPLVVSRRRLHEDGRSDPVSESLSRTFGKLGLPCRTNVSFSGQGASGECDVVVVVDEVVLALECKHSLLPTGAHEMLTSVDYIRTAATQLGKFSSLFQNAEFRTRFARQTGLAFPDNAVLVTGIIMSNRMLIGWRQDGHPVRGMYELVRFVEEGTVTIGDESRSLWIGGRLCGEDLRRFFQDDITYTPQWNCMEPFVLRYEFPGCTVEVPRLGINMLKMARELGFAKAEAEMLKQIADQDTSLSRGGESHTP